MFLMHGAQKQDVTMRCAYSVIDKVIDRFGEDIRIIPISDDEFEITWQFFQIQTSWNLQFAKLSGTVENLHVTAILPHSLSCSLKCVFRGICDYKND